MIRVGVLGYGYWGPNLARAISQNGGCRLAAVADCDPARLKLALTRHPSIEVVATAEEVLQRPDIDAIAVAVPPSLHFPYALEALRQGKHVLVEKPLAESSDQCRRLMEEAQARGLTLMVDHVFVYTPAVAKIRELTQQSSFGELLYYDSMRANLGLFQPDVNVLWDLAVHDLSILEQIEAGSPVAVSSTGMSQMQSREYISYLTLFYERPLIAHIAVNWLAPVKIRQVMVCGSHRMIVYDDVLTSEKVRVYDKGVSMEEKPTPDNARKIRINYRTGDMWAPHLDAKEALSNVVEHFVECIESGKAPKTGGLSGLRVTKVLEAAEQSMGGAAVQLRSVEWRPALDPTG